MKVIWQHLLSFQQVSSFHLLAAIFAKDIGDCDGRKQSPIAFETLEYTHIAKLWTEREDCTPSETEFVIKKKAQMSKKTNLAGVCNLPYIKIPAEAIS